MNNKNMNNKNMNNKSVKLSIINFYYYTSILYNLY